MCAFYRTSLPANVFFVSFSAHPLAAHSPQNTFPTRRPSVLSQVLQGCNTSPAPHDLAPAAADLPILLDYGVQVRLPNHEQTLKSANQDGDDLTIYCDIASSTEKATQVSTRISVQQKSSSIIQFQAFSDRQIKAFCGVERGVVSFLSFKSSLKDS